MTRFVLMALESPIEVRIDTGAAPAADLTELVDSWAWCRAPVSVAPQVVLRATLDPGADPVSAAQLAPDAVPLELSARSVEELAERLTQAVARIALARQRPSFSLFHAAGLAHPETGAVIALVGASGAGKSTATRALARGLDYVSDEAVAVGATGRVVAYPKPVSIKIPGRPWKRQAGPGSLGFTQPASGRLRLRRLVVLDRRTDHDGAPELRPLDFHTMLRHVVPQMSYFSRTPRPLATLAALAGECGGVFALRYREADDLLPPVVDLLDDRRLRPGVARARVADEITLSGVHYLEVGGESIALDGAAAAVWRMLETPQSISAVVEAMRAEFGEPDGRPMAVAVEEYIDQLVSYGVLARVPLPV